MTRFASPQSGQGTSTVGSVARSIPALTQAFAASGCFMANASALRLVIQLSSHLQQRSCQLLRHPFREFDRVATINCNHVDRFLLNPTRTSHQVIGRQIDCVSLYHPLLFFRSKTPTHRSDLTSLGRSGMWVSGLPLCFPIAGLISTMLWVASAFRHSRKSTIKPSSHSFLLSSFAHGL